MLSKLERYWEYLKSEMILKESKAKAISPKAREKRKKENLYTFWIDMNLQNLTICRTPGSRISIWEIWSLLILSPQNSFWDEVFNSDDEDCCPLEKQKEKDFGKTRRAPLQTYWNLIILWGHVE